MKPSFLQKLSAALVALALAAPAAFGIGSEFYDHTTYPSQGAVGSSSAMRAELDLIEAGFGKLPTLTGNGGKITAVNSGGTAIEAITTTGTGSGVRATSPTLVTPLLGTPTSVVLTNATGLPIGTGVSGLGTGVATALAVNVGSSGAPVVQNGALGTPSSGVATNLTGTAAGLTAGVATTVTTNANLTGHVTSVGNAAVLGSFTAAQLNTAISDADIVVSGANSSITSLTGLTTPLSVAQGGTAGATAADARTALGVAASGANSDITSLTGLTTPLTQAQGGTGTALTSRPVLQVERQQSGGVSTGLTTIPLDDSIPTSSEGDEYITLPFTPKSATSLIVVEVNFFLSCNQANAYLIVNLLKDTTSIAVAAEQQTLSTGMANVKLSVSFTSGSTTAFTFRVRAGNHVGGTTTLNGGASGRYFGGNLVSSITATEYL